MRLLFSCTPLTGHLLPLLPLARAAARAGHEVVIASGPDLCAEIERQGFAAWPVGPSMAEIRALMAGTVPEPGTAPGPERVFASALGMFIRPSGSRAVELRLRAEDWRPDVVVQEPYELGAGFVQPATGRRIVHGLGADYPRFADFVAMGHGQLSAMLGLPDPHRAYLDAPYLDPFPARLQPPVRPWRDIRPIRPEAGIPVTGAADSGATLPESFRRLPYERTVYLTLGTVFTAIERWRALLAGVASLPVNVVATTGPGLDPAELGSLPTNVAAECFVPQALILPHCSAVVCHAGAGTVLGALSAGLPLVLLPAGADQFQNAAAVVRAGAGIMLAPEEVSAATVAAAVRTVLDDAARRDAARLLGRDLAALPSADDALADVLSEARATVSG
ncbi:glycosyltransferase [Microlunatus ginsengisoli]|uniref:Glycosyltransferase n=1 Tax=Microlunatus ginsengisoli TaxID=363863 RepID=A0ABP6ZYT3_9ACTN